MGNQAFAWVSTTAHLPVLQALAIGVYWDFADLHELFHNLVPLCVAVAVEVGDSRFFLHARCHV